MSDILLQNAVVVNENTQTEANVYVKHGRIYDILPLSKVPLASKKIDLKGDYLLPGLIDDQVHFREPGLTHKGDIFTESRAAIAGGITSYMEMPNTNPSSTTLELLEQKYAIAAKNSAANYSFYLGASPTNLEEIKKADFSKICGVKIFVGSSTGNLLVDDYEILERIFRNTKSIIAIHSENDHIINANLQNEIEKYGDDIPVERHPFIRSREACFSSTEKLIALAKKTNARIHILHISTAEEAMLFDNSIPLEEKRITAEACVHHLFFNDEDYKTKGNLIKWNPAVKTEDDRLAIIKALNENRIDVLATDHAPHTLEEKANKYRNCPSGGPLVQHALPMLMELVKRGELTMEKIVEKYCHNPVKLFKIENRGYIREGYAADLVIVGKNKAKNPVSKADLLYKCAWSPIEGNVFNYKINSTILNGNLVYHDNKVNSEIFSERLKFSQ